MSEDTNRSLERMASLPHQQHPVDGERVLHHPPLDRHAVASDEVTTKVRLLAEYFFARNDTFAFAPPNGKPRPGFLPSEDTDTLENLLRAHVAGASAPSVRIYFERKDGTHDTMEMRARIGSYALAPDGTVVWGCLDFDGGAGHANALADPRGAALYAVKKAEELGIPAYLEVSRSGAGYHLWLFFPRGTPAWRARGLGLLLAPARAPLANGGEADPKRSVGIEVFPKAPRVAEGGVGTMVFLPWYWDAPDGANQFVRVAAEGSFEVYLPETFERISSDTAERLLADAGVSEAGVFAKVPQVGMTAPREGVRHGDAPASSFQSAVDRYNAEHPRSYPSSGGQCPACGHKGCFGQLAGDTKRWSCFSASHGSSEVGREGEGCWYGDALDLDAHEVGLSRPELLRKMGYLGEAGAMNTGAVASPAAGVPAQSGDGVSPAAVLQPSTALGVSAPAPAAPLPSAPRSSQAIPPVVAAAPAQVSILISTDEHRVIEEASRALANDPETFQRGGILVAVSREANPPKGSVFPPGAPRIQEMPSARLRERLTVVVDWRKKGKGKTKSGKPKKVPAHPPTWAIQGVGARGGWEGVRTLLGVVETPVLRPDGTVLDVPGYDEATGLLYEPKGTFPAIAQAPTLADALMARDELLDVVCDFPFLTEAHRAAWLAALLTPLARFAFEGPSPLFLVDANTRGSGKTLACDTIGYVVLGGPMSLMPMADTDEEMRKQITTHALAGSRLVLIDNVAGTMALGCASMDAALTRTRWSDRLLSTNKALDVPLFAVWYATGNNVHFAGDLSRRTLHIRLETDEERPEMRGGFRHPDLLGWVARERGRLVAAALTMLRAYFVAGCPKKDLPSWGSFEGWSNLIRQVLVWTGTADPADTREELISTSDTEANALHELLEGLLEMDPERKGMGASFILQRLEVTPGSYNRLRDAISELLPGQAKVTAGRLGKKLANLRGRISGGKMLANLGEKGGSKLWAVTDAKGKEKSGKAANVTPPTTQATPEPETGVGQQVDDADFS
ncbi:hypothetical protein F0U62_17420 [Cystobacter fuscus]|uniref:TOTE conflict system archaeo-eukaryotic primase domain-containing protein n=1 Tax=Cystobacter fuscus TaxID=43 RepID=UPI002B2D4AA7|nr:hypothetical protein F0U62_17420 [Cystobacter fuscus]